MKNMTTVKKELMGDGFKIQPMEWPGDFYAVQKDHEGDGIRARFTFGAQLGAKGKPLESILVSVFPLFNAERSLCVNGSRAREFQAAKKISATYPSVVVRSCGRTSAVFKAGHFVDKF
jgi:hypothetical protein